MPLEIEGKVYLNTNESAKYVGISRQTLNKKGLRKYQLGIARDVYYLRDDLDQLRKLHPVKPDEA